MDQQLSEIRTQIEQLQRDLNQQKLQCQQALIADTNSDNEDITTAISSGDQIQLESYKSIPEFSGNKTQYRSWRNQVVRRMKMIDGLKTHPKYEAALGIIRAKIIGAASDVLTNYKTAYNINAIIKRLDKSYADQRPLYVVEAEMTSIKQSNTTLQEFYDAINQALNMVISKIVMSYTNHDEQKSLVSEAQQKAIRTFIVGLKSHVMRNILYSQKPKTLAEAFTTAQTVFYDTEYLQLEQRQREFPKNHQRMSQQQNSSGKQQIQNSPIGFNMNMNCNQPKNKADTRDVNTSNRFKQNTNFQQFGAQMNGQKPVQQPHKVQRINQIRDSESVTNGEINGGEDIPDDLISNSSHVSHETEISSAFLDA